jgi:hypothetical protein
VNCPGRCSLCRYSVPVPKSHFVECHRSPPQVQHWARSANPTWPTVSETDWCGEFSFTGGALFDSTAYTCEKVVKIEKTE